MSLKYTFWGIVATLLVGCASLGLESPQSLDQRIAYAYGTHTAVVNAAADSLRAGELKVEDANDIMSLAEEARSILDSARIALSENDPTSAEGRLLLATEVLQELQDYLRTKRTK